MDFDTLWILHNRITRDSEYNNDNIRKLLQKYNITLYDNNGNIKDTIVILKDIQLLYNLLYYNLLYSKTNITDDYKQLINIMENICETTIGKRKAKEMLNFIIFNNGK